jgi:hypothetical protein
MTRDFSWSIFRLKRLVFSLILMKASLSLSLLLLLLLLL